MATAAAGSRKSSPNEYGFTVFVLLTLVAEELKILSEEISYFPVQKSVLDAGQPVSNGETVR